MSTSTYTVEAIGRVEAADASFLLRIDEPYRGALTELEGFSHINVLFWCHYVDTPEYRAITVAERPYAGAPAAVGIFATRSPVRPNPVGLTAVPVMSIDEEAGIVVIPFIDAENGSPILDIKPYHPSVDRIREVSVPEWCAHWPQWYEDSMTFDWGSVFENAQ